MRDPELVARAHPDPADADPAGPAPVGSVAVRSASAGQADRISAGRHRRLPEFALLGAPVPFGRGRQSADQARDLAGWTSGELPGQVNEQLTSWPPSADQPPASV